MYPLTVILVLIVLVDAYLILQLPKFHPRFISAVIK